MKQTPRSRSVCCRATIAAMGAALGASLSAASHAQEAPPPVAPPVVTDSLLPPLPPPPLVPSDSAPLAGYTNGTFFLRSPSNNFVLFPDGRLNVDGYFFPARPDAPAGVTADGPADPRPKNTFNVRRARAEFSGQFLQHFNYYMGGEFGTIPGGAQYGTFTDVFINVDYTPWANLQIGQFDAPFTLENRTSDKYFDFLERSVAVRGVGVPLNKELGAMLWGWPRASTCTTPSASSTATASTSRTSTTTST